jgi:hypothetical protein
MESEDDLKPRDLVDQRALLLEEYQTGFRTLAQRSARATSASGRRGGRPNFPSG